MAQRGEFGPEDAPIIGVARWEPGKGGGVREIPPDTCPWGHDVRPDGSMWVGWHHGHSLRMYTCRACYQAGGGGYWCVQKDERAMWQAHLDGGGTLPPGQTIDSLVR
ncbi:hypothetical protein [Prauserella endophytica]|uniref:Uncharacterized protein n=1 Tax=Prauserella endophytica TaxID=1592324 RepID=A0ABY2RW91_9PSEU|nr:hypothetical protein [Prauserella endophytica]TKG63095.1 hypothetical protein FCN18_30455 [Prauserella endophytica]